MKHLFKKISWGPMLFLTLTPLIGFGGLAFLINTDALRWSTVAFALVMTVATGLGVTAGYHRLFAHKSYEAKRWVKVLLLFFGAASFENSALNWASDHRNHHKFVDTEQDPYNVKQGFWHAHIGWILFNRRIKPRRDNVDDLRMDRAVLFQDRWFGILSLFSGLVFPMAVAALWSDALGGLLLGGFLRIVLNHHFTFSINSVCHYLGRQPYSDRNSSRDSFIPALFTYGEGYHNYHHTFPADYRNGIRAYHWDPTKWLIRALAWMGQASDLRRMPTDRILQVRLRMDEKRILRKLEQRGELATRRPAIAAARAQIETAHAYVLSVRADYTRLKKQKMTLLQDQWRVSKRTLKNQMRDAQRRFRAEMENWQAFTAA